MRTGSSLAASTPTASRCGIRPALAGLLVAALAVASPPLEGQEREAATDSAGAARAVILAGVVRDTAGRPLSGAEVRAGGELFTLSEADGTFLLSGVPGDTVHLLVRRIGYVPADVELAVEPHVRRVELAVKMVPTVQELGTITIEGRTLSTRLLRTGFYDRQKLGMGTFFGADDLKHFGGTLGGLLHGVPSVRVAYGRGNVVVPMGPSGFGGQCPLNVFLDGVYIRFASDIGINNLIASEDILAIEVYPRASDVPAVLAGHTGGVESVGGGLPPMGGSTARGVGNVDCGAIVIWSRPFDPKP